MQQQYKKKCEELSERPMLTSRHIDSSTHSKNNKNNKTLHAEYM